MPDRSHKHTAAPVPTKSCVTCGRQIEWRKKWERDWENIRFCSDGCRHHRPTAQDRDLESAILDLLAQRGRDKTICPSEAARVVASRTSADPEAWRPLMEPARAAARRLVAADRILITQGGHTVDPSTAKGPIRLRLR